jgi:hypothetical protein
MALHEELDEFYFLPQIQARIRGFFTQVEKLNWVAYLADLCDFRNEWDVSVQCYLHYRRVRQN